MNAHEAELLRSIRRGRTIRLALLGVVFAIPLAYGFVKLVGAFRVRMQRNAELEAEREATRQAMKPERDELARIAHDAPQRLAAAEAAWTAVVRRDVLGAVAPGEEPCKRAVDRDLVVVKPGESIPDADPDLARAKEELPRLRAALDDDDDLSTESTSRARWAIEPSSTIVVLVDELHEPQTAGKDYIPGSIEGTAYLFDISTGTIACTAHVFATSSDSISVQYSYRQADMLDRDVQGTLAARRELDHDLALSLRGEVGRGLRVVR